MRNGMNKLLAVTAVLACVCMWGCSGKTEWNNSFGGAEVVGFINDSLVIVYDSQGWHHDLGSFIQDHGDISGRGHQRLRVFNYRVQEDGPRWADTLDNDDIEDFNYVKGQLSDSVIWGGDPKSEVSFWKIGSKPHKMKVKKVFDGCSLDVRYTTKLRHWLDGKILVMGNTLNPDIEGFNLDSLGSDYCQYAVLDTIQKVITYKRLNADLIWIKRCDDVRAWGDDVICLMPGEHPLEGNILKNKVDTLSAPLAFSKGFFWGNMIELRASICRLNTKGISCLDTAYTWREPLKFYQNDEIVVDLE